MLSLKLSGLIIYLGIILIQFLKKNQKQICLLVSFFSLNWILILCIISPINLLSYYKLERWVGYLDCGLDDLSSIFLLLTNLVMIIGVLASWGKIKNKYENFFYSTLLFLHFILILVFISVNILSFYIFFEASLIPMYYLIGIFGSRKRKIYAAHLFFLMTLAGSLVTLLTFLIIISDLGSYDYLTIRSIGINKEREWIIWLGIFLSFAVKTPVIPIHLWLPEAHTEANITGSIILAGILLKLSTYGFLRFSIGCLSKSSLYYTPLVYIISIISLINSSLVTLRQIDLKKIIAYSSIGHMSLVNIGIFTQRFLGLDGGIYLAISHGISSPGLFILVTLLYERFHTRIIKYYRGMVSKMPIFSIFFMFFILSNMAIPLTGNFIGELLILAGSFSINPYFTILASLGIILSGAYSIWVNNRILFGKLIVNLKEIRDVYFIEFMKLLPLVIILIIMGISHSAVGSVTGPISLVHYEVYDLSIICLIRAKVKSLKDSLLKKLSPILRIYNNIKEFYLLISSNYKKIKNRLSVKGLKNSLINFRYNLIKSCGLLIDKILKLIFILISIGIFILIILILKDGLNFWEYVCPIEMLKGNNISDITKEFIVISCLTFLLNSLLIIFCLKDKIEYTNLESSWNLLLIRLAYWLACLLGSYFSIWFLSILGLFEIFIKTVHCVYDDSPSASDLSDSSDSSDSSDTESVAFDYTNLDGYQPGDSEGLEDVSDVEDKIDVIKNRIKYRDKLVIQLIDDVTLAKGSIELAREIFVLIGHYNSEAITTNNITNDDIFRAARESEIAAMIWGDIDHYIDLLTPEELEALTERALDRELDMMGYTERSDGTQVNLNENLSRGLILSNETLGKIRRRMHEIHPNLGYDMLSPRQSSDSNSQELLNNTSNLNSVQASSSQVIPYSRQEIASTSTSNNNVGLSNNGEGSSTSILNNNVEESNNNNGEGSSTSNWNSRLDIPYTGKGVVPQEEIASASNNGEGSSNNNGEGSSTSNDTSDKKGKRPLKESSNNNGEGSSTSKNTSESGESIGKKRKGLLNSWKDNIKKKVKIVKISSNSELDILNRRSSDSFLSDSELNRRPSGSELGKLKRSSSFDSYFDSKRRK